MQAGLGIIKDEQFPNGYQSKLTPFAGQLIIFDIIIQKTSFNVFFFYTSSVVSGTASMVDRVPNGSHDAGLIHIVKDSHSKIVLPANRRKNIVSYRNAKMSVSSRGGGKHFLYHRFLAC